MPYTRHYNRGSSSTSTSDPANTAVTIANSYYQRQRGSRRKQSEVQKLKKIMSSVQPTSTFKRFIYPECNDYLTLNSGNGYANYCVFSGNSLYDPDVTGAGGQPVGFDEYGALYSRYNAYASKISVTIKPNSIPNGVAVTMYLVAVHSPSSLVLTGEAIEGMHKMKKSVYTNQSTARLTTTLFCKSKEVFPGYNPRSSDFNALWTANPGARWYWHIVLLAQDSAAETIPYFDVRIEYYANLEEPIQLGRS